MTDTIRKIIESAGAMICPSCDGEGEIGYFCGHDSSSSCYKCAGRGVVKSLEKHKERRGCLICAGRGCGHCNSKGYIEWETFELFS